MRARELRIERMTSPEIEAAIAGGADVAVVACGAVEQHGPHLPLSMDAAHGDAQAEAVARRLGNALVAPTIRVGCSEHHMRFAGTVSLREATLEAICTDYCTSLARHGFRTIYLIPTHGGNFGPLAAMRERLDRAAGPDTRVVAYTELQAMVGVWREVIEAEAGLGERVGGHADIAETSIMLALDPDAVREGRAEAGYGGPLDDAVLARLFRDGIGALSPNGILGDARGATADLGRRCVEAVADLLTEHLRRALAEGPA